MDLETDRVALADQILLDRFEVVLDPLGWCCKACRSTVTAPPELSGGTSNEAVFRLAEAAADHALYCGRCDD